MSIIDEPVTFWLDAHESSATSTLLQELEVLKNHPIKTHSILIDDLRMWKRHKIGFDTEILKEKLLEINPNYKIKI
jgi:hypothetical protein